MSKKAKLTDRQIKTMYSGLLSIYSELAPQYGTNNAFLLLNELKSEVNKLLTPPFGMFKDLSEEDKQRLRDSTQVFFDATPIGQQFRGRVPPAPTSTATPNIRSRNTQRNYFQSNRGWGDFIFISYSSGNNNGPRSYNRRNEERQQNQSSDLLASLAIVFIAVIAVTATAIATFYLLKELSHNLERLYYNEGMMQAAVSMLATTAFSISSYILLDVFATMPLATFAVSLGVLNPMGAAFVGVCCLSIVSTAAASLIFTKIQNSLITRNNQDALDPLDPHRYSLSEKQKQNLDKKGFNCNAVTLALIALRAEMKKDKPLHVIFGSRDKNAKEMLNIIRKLKVGDVPKELKVGEMSFNLSKPAPAPRPSATFAGMDTTFGTGFSRPPATNPNFRNPYSQPTAPQPYQVNYQAPASYFSSQPSGRQPYDISTEIPQYGEPVMAEVVPDPRIQNPSQTDYPPIFLGVEVSSNVAAADDTDYSGFFNTPGARQ